MVGDDEELECDDFVQGHNCLQYKRLRAKLWIILGVFSSTVIWLGDVNWKE